MSNQLNQSEGSFPDNLLPPLNISKDLSKRNQNSDDPFQYSSDFSPRKIKLTELSWVTKAKLPIKTLPSNNNVSITVHDKKLFLAFRSSQTHFAGNNTHLYILSSRDGQSWKSELDVFEKTDLREPQLAVLNGKLNFFYFKGGSNPLEFSPSNIFKIQYLGPRKWGNPEIVLRKGEVPWEIKTRENVAYLSSYSGPHYRLAGKSAVKVHFQRTIDGEVFIPAQGPKSTSEVYVGGVSEVGWEFDHQKNLWAVTRNEDGDDRGFGSQLMYAPKDRLNEWRQVGETDPNCYMSPKMFRVGKEIFLIGRKHLGDRPFDRTDPESWMIWRRINNWLRHSLTPKGTALYRINREIGKIEHVMDLPGHGDTAFPSIHRLNESEFLIANYSSPINQRKRPWILGQLLPTEIYISKLKFN